MGNQTVDGPHWLMGEKNTMDVWGPIIWHSSKYLLLCSAEQRSS